MSHPKYIYLELFIAYVPLVLLWLVGVLALPFGFSLAYSGQAAGYVLLASVLLGFIGVWGVMQLSRKIIWPESKVSISIYRPHIIVGCLASTLGGIFFVGIFNAVATYAFVTVIVTMHLYRVSNANS